MKIAISNNQFTCPLLGKVIKERGDLNFGTCRICKYNILKQFIDDNVYCDYGSSSSGGSGSGTIIVQQSLDIESLDHDQDIDGTEKIPVSSEGNLKYVTVDELIASSEVDAEQNTLISEIQDKLNMERESQKEMDKEQSQQISDLSNTVEVINKSRFVDWETYSD